MTRGVDASVVIAVWNGWPLLGEQLEALARQRWSGSWEVIVADNGSSDGTPERVLEYADRLPDLRVVPAHARKGCGPARNVGAQAATGRWLLFLDADDVVEDGWLAGMMAAAAHGALLAGRLDERRLNHSELQAWRPQVAATGPHQAFGLRSVPVGANFGIRADVFRDLGGFEERLGELGAGEDVNLGWRAHEAGYPTVWVPKGVVCYRHRPALRPLMRQWHSYGLASVLNYKLLRPSIPRFDPVGFGRLVGSLVLKSPWHLANPARRGRWLRIWATLAGQLRGSLRYRCLYLG